MKSDMKYRIKATLEEKKGTLNTFFQSVFKTSKFSLNMDDITFIKITFL